MTIFIRTQKLIHEGGSVALDNRSRPVTFPGTPSSARGGGWRPRLTPRRKRGRLYRPPSPHRRHRRPWVPAAALCCGSTAHTRLRHCCCFGMFLGWSVEMLELKTQPSFPLSLRPHSALPRILRRPPAHHRRRRKKEKKKEEAAAARGTAPAARATAGTRRTRRRWARRGC